MRPRSAPSRQAGFEQHMGAQSEHVLKHKKWSCSPYTSAAAAAAFPVVSRAVYNWQGLSAQLAYSRGETLFNIKHTQQKTPCNKHMSVNIIQDKCMVTDNLVLQVWPWPHV